VQEDLTRLLGVEGEPTFRRITRHAHAIAQYNLGYQRFHTAMEGAELELPGLFMGGSLRNGPSMSACIRAGIELSARVANADKGRR
jgi:oxygen-dependent protoporphyrinogen oxidase